MDKYEITININGIDKKFIRRANDLLSAWNIAKELARQNGGSIVDVCAFI